MKCYRRASFASRAATKECLVDTLFHGNSIELIKELPDESVDLVFSSPPYCMGKEYESTTSVEDFTVFHEAIVPELVRVVRKGGSVCWQVGYHVNSGNVTPLDFLAHAVFCKHPSLRLRNRIVWSFAHGLHAKKRFSGRHETVLWYSKGESDFNLDAVRIRQKYPGKRAYRGPRKGEYSGNPLGKNPGDVWSIPNVKGHHVEKTIHPCQFPVALPHVFVRALTRPDALIFDPFMGVGSTGVAAALEGRRFVGAELQGDYLSVAQQRIRDARRGRAIIRPFEQPIHEPRSTDSVAQKPAHFRG